MTTSNAANDKISSSDNISVSVFCSCSSFYIYSMLTGPSFKTLKPSQMTATLQTTFLTTFFLNEHCCIFTQFLLECVPNDSNTNILTMVQIMARRRTGTKPLSELVMANHADVFMRHSMSFKVFKTRSWGSRFLSPQIKAHTHAEVSLQQDDVIKWKHFICHWPFVQGIHWSPVNSPHKGLWRGALMFSLICSWINGWVNNLEAGDLSRHRTIMTSL